MLPMSVSVYVIRVLARKTHLVTIISEDFGKMIRVKSKVLLCCCVLQPVFDLDSKLFYQCLL